LAERSADGMPDRANAPIEIVQYDPAWPDRFEVERRRLAGMLPGADIEHFGSTAVPGLAAKPVVDIIALVDDLDAPIPVLIERGGYSFPVEYNATLERRRWMCWPGPERRIFHLTLTDHRGEFERRLEFRDALRADPALAREYEELKRSLADRFRDDREAYTAAKSAFIARGVSGA
jgi:GrpB-like predicted nucleotidyltransferase (UPF0157 family)